MDLPLNFDWDFHPGFDLADLKMSPSASIKVDLPHYAAKTPLDYFDESLYTGIFTYSKTIDIDDVCRHISLVFDGVMLQFDLYVNENKVGHYISGYLPVKANLDGYLAKGKNRIVVVTDSREDPSIPPFGKVVDYMTFAGIYRPVHLLIQNKDNYISSLYIVADMEGNITVKANKLGEGYVHHELYAGKEKVLSFDGESAKLDNPHLYSSSDPYLYKLVSTYGEDCLVNYIGFKSIRVDEKGLFVNSKKEKIRGLNRHQTYPYIGGAASKRLQEEDAQIIKNKLGCNCVRTSHYADSEDFLNECDRLGLYVIDEIPGWQFISKEKPWRDQCLDFTRRLIQKERNHPSLLFYGLRIDEGPDDHELYSAVRKIHQEEDPTHPSIGVRNFKDSELLEDVYGYNDFSCSSLAHGLDKASSWKGAKGKPKLVTENNGHMFPIKSYDTVDRRAESALRHATVINEAYAQDELLGSIAWCAFDYNTHKDFGSGNHICHHGVCDAFRVRKTSGYFYASQGEEPTLYCSSSLQGGDYNASSYPKIYLFTNCDFVKGYKGEFSLGTFKPGEEFKNLPHPPMLIDDLIGDQFNEPGYSDAEKKLLVGLLNKASRGLRPKDLKPLEMAKLLKLAIKHHLNMRKLEGLYTKYINGWGEEVSTFKFVGYKDNKPVKEINIGPANFGHLEANASTYALTNEDTYDSVRIEVIKKDQYGNQCAYAFDALSISVEGPIELLGPNLVSLQGGDTAIFVRSLKVSKEETAKVKIHSETEDLELTFKVK